MAEGGNRMTKMQMADAVYDRVMAKKQELEGVQKNIDDTAKLAEQYDAGMYESVKLMKGSKDLTNDQKQMIKEVEEAFQATKDLKKLERERENIEKEINTHEQNIINAIATYIEDTEKEINNVTEKKEKCNEDISKAKEEYETLKKEIDELVAQNDPDNKDIIDYKKAELAAKENVIAAHENKLKSYEDRLANASVQFEAYKAKYKELWDKAQEKAAVAKETTEVETPTDETEVPSEEATEVETPTDETEVPSEEATEVETPTDGTEVPSEETDDKKKGKLAKGHVVYGGTPTATAEEEKPRESDEAAYRRISRLLIKRKTRDLVSDKDINRILEILSKSDIYQDMPTHRPFLVFRSDAEKVFTQLGKIVSSKVNKFVGDKDTRMAIQQELTDWKEMIDINAGSPETLAEKSIAELEDISEKDMEAFELAKSQLGSYRNAVNMLSSVRLRRKGLPEPKTNAKVEHKSEPAPSDLGDKLSGMVNDEPTMTAAGERTEGELTVDEPEEIDVQ